MSNVTHPTHYNSGKIEVIEAIEDWGLGFHRGNAVKYIARAGKKDPNKEIEDLEKATWYLKREIERLQALKESRVPIRPNDMNPRASAESISATNASNSAPPESPQDTAPAARSWVQWLVDGRWLRIVGDDKIVFAPYDQSDIESLINRETRVSIISASPSARPTPDRLE